MKAKVTYWRESDGKYLGYLNDHPDLMPPVCSSNGAWTVR